MSDVQPVPAPVPARKAFPREAVKAIAGCGLFCGLSTAFLAYYAWRHGYHPFFIGLNAFTTAFLMAGSVWMLRQLKRV